jgi:uroporphyrinogen decarboxylase
MEMDKLERVDAVLAGREPDRPPLSLWYHFGVQHGSGEQFARLSLEYFHHYDFDFLKVMNDYFYPPPRGLDAVRTAADLKRIRPIGLADTDWVQQLRALEVIARELSGRAYFIDTVFDPWQSIRRSMAGENMKLLMEEAPGALQEALDIVADTLINYCQKSLAAGAAGIFMSIPAAAEIVTRDEFLTFVKTPAKKVLSAISGSGRMNTAHIHGQTLFFDDCLDFPVSIFSWWDRGPQGPPMSEVKQKIDGCVMGGIDQTVVARSSAAFLKKHVTEGRRLGGSRRFILANGCSIDTWTYPGSIRAIVEAARAVS